MGPSSSTSCSRSTSKRSRTHRRASETSAATSAELALPPFSMKLACTLEMRGAADHVALEPAGLDQRAGAGALVRVLEDRAERARLARLALAATALHVPHARPDLVAGAVLQLQDGRGDDLRCAHVGVPVAQVELVRAAADARRPPRRRRPSSARRGSRCRRRRRSCAPRRPPCPGWRSRTRCRVSAASVQRRTTAASEAPPPQRTPVPSISIAASAPSSRTATPS